MLNKEQRREALRRLATWQTELDYWNVKLAAHRRGEQTPPVRLILTNILQYTTALKQLRATLQRGPYVPPPTGDDITYAADTFYHDDYNQRR